MQLDILGGYYGRHVSAMTSEGLHRKSAIAAELGYRDSVIDALRAENAELKKDADRYRWLEANSTYGIDYRQRPELTLPIYAPDHREGLGAAIDKAMKGEGDE